MRIGSLFSGIGGLELGLERSRLGHTVWQVEQNAFCRRILEKHWPRAIRFSDVRAVGKGNLAPVDVLCGGFPCQDLSSAGNRAGLGGKRSGLWREFSRIVEELQPDWVVVENVASGARLWVDTVVCDLGQLGYESLPIPLSASDCGASHQRSRIFIVAAHADSNRKPVESQHAQVEATPKLTDLDGDELREQSRGRSRTPGGSATESSFPCWWEPEPEVVRVVHGVSRGLDSPVKALGNAVVPQCAEVIGYVIQELRTSFNKISRGNQ